MATQKYTQTAKVRLIYEAGQLVLDPLDAEANALMAVIQAAEAGNTTVAHTLEDANRDGYAQTGGAYNVYKLAFS